MSAVMEAYEPSSKHLSALQSPLVRHFELMATERGGVARLRELILTLAVQGKLIAQDSKDEPASELLKKIRSKKAQLISEGKLKREKPQAEIAEEEQPFELPNGWAWVRLTEIAYPQAGFAFKSSGFNEVRQGLPLIRIRDVGGNDPATYFSGEYREEFVVESGDWLISMDGEFRVREWTGPKALLNQRVTRLVFFGGALFQPFVTAALQFKLSELQGTKAYTTVDHLSGGQIAHSVVALPPLAEQSRIVTRVEQLMRLCDALEAKGQLEAAQHAQLVQTLLGTLTSSGTPDELADNWQRVATHLDLLLDRPEAIDALEQTILQLATTGRLTEQHSSDLVSQASLNENLAEESPFDLPATWVWATLGQLSALITSGSRGWKDFYADDGATFIRSQDIKYDRLEFDDRAFVKLPPGAEGIRTRVRLRDILITITGANVGKAAVVPDSVAEGYVSQHVALVRLLDPRVVEFLHLWLINEFGGRRLLLSSSYGAKPGLNLQNIKELPVPVPPLVEQVRIVARVESLRRLCADLRQRLIDRQTTQTRLAEALIDEVA